MSYFPPPPPPPPPPTQASPPTNFADRFTGHRGRGNGGHRGWGGGAHVRGASQVRGRGGHSRGFNSHRGHFDWGGNAPKSFDHHGQIQQHPPSYVPQAPCVQSQLSNSAQQAIWNVRPAVVAEPIHLQVPPNRIGFATQPRGMQSDAFQASPNFQPNPHSSRDMSTIGSNGMNVQPQPLRGFQPSLSTSRGRGHKRGYGEAFEQRGGGKRFSSRPTAPAVPSFGGSLPLPSGPQVHGSTEKRTRKEERHTNKLGLTPRTEDHASVDESEDDENEETKLAANGNNGLGKSQPLQIHYRGRTSTLNSTDDIAAWLEERKKRYPTKARATETAERKRQIQESRKAARQAQQESRQKAIVDAKEKRAQQNDGAKERKKNKKEDISIKEEKTNSEDATTKAKRKLEELRRRLEKEERRIARAEAKIAEGAKNTTDGSQTPAAEQTTKCNKRKRSPTPPSTERRLSQSLPHDVGSPGSDEIIPSQDTDPSSIAAPQTLTSTSRQRNPNEAQDPVHRPDELIKIIAERPQTPTDLQKHPSSASSTPSSKLTFALTSDETSSSGSSSFSSSDSDIDSDDAPPSETTTKRDRPDKVLPPPREQSKRICKFFVANRGKCRFSNKCRFRHELPERRSKKDNPARVERQTGAVARKGRVGLFQRLVEQEKRAEEEANREAEERGGAEEGLTQGLDGRTSLAAQ